MQDRVVGSMADATYWLFPTAGAGGMTRFKALEAQAFLSQFGDFLVRVKRCEDIAVNRSVAFATHAT